MISIKAHEALDYILGFVLITFPIFCGITDADGRLAFNVMGMTVITYSFASRYFLSVRKFIAVSKHMTLDIVMGVLTILAPFLFGYRPYINTAQFGLHLALGLGIIVFVGITHYRHDESIAGPKITLDTGVHW